MIDRLLIDPSHSREILYEVMEELMLIGMIEALQSVMEYQFESGSENCAVIPVEDVEDMIKESQDKIRHLRQRLYRGETEE